jgi:hypothetical protein
MNLLTHDQLFSAKTAPQQRALPSGSGGSGLPARVAQTSTALVESEPHSIEDEDDPLAVIIRKACSRELTDLGLTFNSLNIKVVQSEVAEARRRQSAAEAQANADIVSATQSRRAKEAQLEAERAISDKQRELEQTKAANAALIAQAEAKRQEAAGLMRTAELDATQIAQARADAAKVRLEAEAAADAEAIRIRKIAEATAESIQKVNQAIQAGGESYFRYRQIEMLPQIASFRPCSRRSSSRRISWMGRSRLPRRPTCRPRSRTHLPSRSSERQNHSVATDRHGHCRTDTQPRSNSASKNARDASVASRAFLCQEWWELVTVRAFRHLVSLDGS